MVATTDFIAFATGVSANVDSQATYIARANNLGYQAGSVATSSWVSKATRQATFIAAGVSQFVANELNINVADDGNLTNFVTNLTAAITAAAQAAASGVSSFNGRTGGVTLSNGDVLTALGGTPLFTMTTFNGDITGNFGTLTIKAGAVTNAKMANMAALTVKANNTSIGAAPQDVLISDLLTSLGFDFSHAGAASGYIIYPGGYKRMWGSGFVADDNVGTITLPIPFTTGIAGFQAGLVYTGSPKSGGNGGGATYNVIDPQHVRVMMAWNGDSTGIGAFTWEAWGI